MLEFLCSYTKIVLVFGRLFNKTFYTMIIGLLLSAPFLIVNLSQQYLVIIVSPTVSSLWNYIIVTFPSLICPQEHFNYYTMDAALSHLVFSMKYEVIGDQEHLRLMLRYHYVSLFPSNSDSFCLLLIFFLSSLCSSQ